MAGSSWFNGAKFTYGYAAPKKEVKENKKSPINIYAKPLPKSAEVIKLE